MANSARTPVTTKSSTAPAAPPAPASTITLAKHYSEMSAAYSTGADCINRLSTMIDGAIAISKGTGAPAVIVLVLTRFLSECQFLSNDLASMLESERDSQAEYASQQEGK